MDTSRQWVAAELPPSRETLQFDTVVCPTPYPIKAGDPVGHLGYFQVPREDGHEKRYQVHIECLTADDLPRFLSNPEGVGRDTPAFARCPKDIPVYLQFSSGEIQKGLITTQTETVMALSGQPYSKAEAFNYRQLLDKIDDGKSTWYNAEQYRRAVQNPSMRDHLNSLCVKHPSDWYYSSETPVWKAFFTPQLKKEAPEWYAYSEKFLIDLHRVPGMMENPWHMHPLVFLDAITMNAKVWCWVQRQNTMSPVEEDLELCLQGGGIMVALRMDAISYLLNQALFRIIFSNQNIKIDSLVCRLGHKNLILSGKNS
ncbi:hypothetical protein DHU18_20815 [Salmonella enterica]|nr:hypothetical protein [Salmonella enterica subsp. arizonae serovar 62:z4,z32:-]EBO3989752.1 hypothetical protein [Salmonella enterica]ECU0525914.1 hypothetical protein [Salmonella enterica]EHD9854787.1 hypothetical protein [Salmonella enterica]